VARSGSVTVGKFTHFYHARVHLTRHGSSRTLIYRCISFLTSQTSSPSRQEAHLLSHWQSGPSHRTNNRGEGLDMKRETRRKKRQTNKKHMLDSVMYSPSIFPSSQPETQNTPTSLLILLHTLALVNRTRCNNPLYQWFNKWVSKDTFLANPSSSVKKSAKSAQPI
jgi:hypothetical protein